MLELARRKQGEAGVDERRVSQRARSSSIPLPDASVDVIISNCVINLSGDKRRCSREAFRVLKPGGRFAVCDVVVRGEVPAAVRQSMELWVGCIAGALEESEFARLLARCGLRESDVRADALLRGEGRGSVSRAVGLDVDAVSHGDRWEVHERVRARDASRRQLPSRAAHPAAAPSLNCREATT